MTNEDCGCGWDGGLRKYCDAHNPCYPVTRRDHSTGFETPAGWHDGVLYCYGGCGTRYENFISDVSLPTPLWNRIAVGPPFDETQEGIEREGRGGVLCPSCIVKRLAALPERTVILMDIA